MLNVKKIGVVKNKNSHEIKSSMFGIGLEKLDRDMYDPTNAYPKLNELGVKYARIQSGWAKTEKEKGVYDFAWLDKIVDNLIKNSIEPWMCLCYGNGLYTPRANDHFMGIGCPPVDTQEEMNAWIRYCCEVVKHFKGRVCKFEIWNEPDGLASWVSANGTNPVLYGNFAMETAKALKEISEDVYVIVGATTCLNSEWIDAMLGTGLYEYADAVSYHRYTALLEEGVLKQVPAFRAVLDKYGIKDLIQGESGCQSQPFGAGALWEGAWDQEKQIKVLLRRELIDLISKVKFASYYSSVDVDEALIGVTGKAYFGVLANVYDEEGKITGKFIEKPSYRALQTVCSTFYDAKVVEGEIKYVPTWSLRYYTEDENGEDFITSFFKKENGAKGFCYYKPTHVMTTAFESTFSCEISGVSGEPRLVDLKDGTVYEFEKNNFVIENGIYRFKNIPVKDYPLLITFGDFIEVSK